MEIVSLVLCSIIALAIFAVFYTRNRYDFWRKKGIPHVEGSFPYGIWADVGKTAATYEMYKNVYDKFKGTGPFAGVYVFTRPSVVLLDLDLIKSVLIKDFINFEDRGHFNNERDDPLRANLVVLEGEKWRTLRGKLSTTFSSGKMKYMFPTVIEVGQRLVATVERESKANCLLDMRDILARFTTDVIGTCVFGIECNCLDDPNVIFRKMGEKALVASPSKNYQCFTVIFPQLARFLRIKHTPEVVTKFFIKLVTDTVNYREKNKIQRNDFMDLCIRLKNEKCIRLGNGEELTALTLAEIIPEAFVFFVAGYETSATTMSLALYSLACNPDVQDKLRREINDTIAKHGGELTYEAIKEMTYLDQVIHETLRMYPTLTQLRRKAKAEYPTSDPKYVIPKGAYVIIPNYAIQKDPDIFPNPDVFDPDRFRPEEVQKRHPMAWLAFGDGPRNCIGLRFARQQVSIGLSLMIRNFKFSLTKNTPVPMKFKKLKLHLTTEEGVLLKVEKI